MDIFITICSMYYIQIGGSLLMEPKPIVECTQFRHPADEQ